MRVDDLNKGNSTPLTPNIAFKKMFCRQNKTHRAFLASGLPVLRENPLGSLGSRCRPLAGRTWEERDGVDEERPHREPVGRDDAEAVPVYRDPETNGKRITGG